MPVVSKDNSGFDPSKYGAVEVPVKETVTDFDPTKYGATEVKKKNNLSVGSDGQLKESVPTISVSQPVPDFGMASFNDLAKGQKSASENTAAVAPKEAQEFAYNKQHEKERAKTREENFQKALDNTTSKALKLKGINAQPGSAQFNEQKSKFAFAIYNGDAHVALDKDGTPGLKRTTGVLENLKKGWEEATTSNDENAAFYDMTPEQRVEFVNKKVAAEKPNEYIGESPSLAGAAAHFGSASAPFLAKAGVGAAAGTLTGGLGAPAAFAFLLTTPDMVNAGVKDEVTRRYQILKNQYPQRSDVENMTEASKGALAGGVGGILTNAAMMGAGLKTPISSEAKGLLGTTLKGIAKTTLKDIADPAMQMGAITGGVTAAQEVEGNLEGIKSDPKEILSHALASFKDNATTGALLTTMLHAPNILKSASKFILTKEANPEAIKSVVQANENIGKVPPGTTEKVMGDLEQFKTIVNTFPEGLTDEVKSSVAGLLQKRENIASEAETKSKSPAIQQLYKDKVEAIDRQIADIQRTGKPLEHEVDEVTGETYKKPTFDNIAAMRVKNLADKISKGKEITDPEELQTEHNFPEEVEKHLNRIVREEKSANRDKENPNTDLTDNIETYFKKNKKEQDAVQVKSADAVDVRQQTENGEGVGNGNVQSTEPTGKETQIKSENKEKQSTVVSDNKIGLTQKQLYNREKSRVEDVVDSVENGDIKGSNISVGDKDLVEHLIDSGLQGREAYIVKEMAERLIKPLQKITDQIDPQELKMVTENVEDVNSVMEGFEDARNLMFSRNKDIVDNVNKEAQRLLDYYSDKNNLPDNKLDNEKTFQVKVDLLKKFLKGDVNYLDLSKFGIEKKSKDYFKAKPITNKELIPETKNQNNETSSSSSIQKEQENGSRQSTGGTQTEVNTIPAEENKGKTEEEIRPTSVQRPPTNLSYMGTGKMETEFGVNERPETVTKHDLNTIKEADNLLEKGWDVKNLLKKVEDGDAHISDAEYVNLTRYGAELSDRLRGLKNEPNSPEYKKTFDELNRVANAANLSGQAQGRALGIRGRFKTVADGSYGDYMLTERDANNGAPLTEAQTEVANKQFTEFEKAKAKFDEDRAKFEEEVSKFNAEKEFNKAKKPATKTSEEKVKAANDKIKKGIEGGREALKKLRSGESGLSAVPLPGVRELIAIAPHVKVALEGLVEKGAIKLSDAVKELYENFKEFGVSEKNIHDIIAGEYNEKKITRKEAAIRKEDLRIEAQLINKLEGLVKGDEPKNEKSKIKRNQEIEALRSKIRDFNKDNPDREAQLKQLKERNEKETAKIKEKIANNDFAIEEKKTPLLDDKEAQKKFPESFKAAQKSRDALIKVKHDITIRRLKQMYENKTPQEKTVEIFSKALNIPRTLMASMDFSAPLRQAIIGTISHPILANDALKFMFRATKDEKVYSRWLDDVHNSPRWETAEKSKLSITDPESLHVREHEEAFQGAPYAEKIPIIGKGVAASERAYVGYLNKIRWDIFNMYAAKFEDQGKTYENNKKLYDGLSSFINSATGRGGMKGLESASPVLNWFLFASKLIASRVNMLGLSDLPNLAVRGTSKLVQGATLGKVNPNWKLDYGFYNSLPKELRIEAGKDMAKFIALGISALLLAKGVSKATNGNIEVEADPRSSDFGKIKSGNTRWDIWGGFQPYARVITQALMGQRKASTTGKIYELDGKGFMGQTRLTPLANFARGKLAPVPSTAVNLISHTDATGQPVSLGGEALSAITPLIINDIYNGMQDQGVKALYTVGIPSAFGVGVQTYQQKDQKSSKSKHSKEPKNH